MLTKKKSQSIRNTQACMKIQEQNVQILFEFVQEKEEEELAAELKDVHKRRNIFNNKN